MQRPWILDLLSFVWLIPAFTQRHSRFKYFFYFLAVSAIGGEFFSVLRLKFNINLYWIINYLYIFLSLAAFCSLIEVSKIPKLVNWVVTCLFIGIMFACIPHPRYSEVVLMFIIHILTSGLIIRIMYIDMVNRKELKLYTILLLMYEYTNVSMFFYSVAGTSIGLENYLLLIKFEIFLGVFFCLFKEQNKYLIYRMKT